MIFFNGEINILDKYASGLITLAIIVSVTCYIFAVSVLMPTAGLVLVK